MKGIVLRLFFVLFCVSCGAVPQIEPLNPASSPGLINEGPTMFPTRGWQFVHSIEATIQARHKAFLIGITDISPALGRIHCVIMTIEGLVLFDALSDKRTVIKRGLKPFDSMAFAQGMMNDVRLIFFRPDGECVATGTLGIRSYVRRYKNSLDTIVDLITHADRTWEIRQYKSGELVRSVKAYLREDAAIEDRYVVPERIELTAQGVHNYRLDLRLIRAEHSAG